MEQTQNMKRALTDFFSSCRKGLIVALLVTNLSGCAVCAGGPHGGVGCAGPWEVSAAIGAMIVASPVLVPALIFFKINEKIGDRNVRARRASEALAQKARNYLKTACEKDELLFIKPGIALNEGILVLRMEDAPLPLLEMAQNKRLPGAIIRWRQGHIDPESREESTRILREIQYGYSIPWDGYDTLYAAWFAFPPSAAVEQKFFIKTGKGKYIQRASKIFWEQAGLGARVLNESPTFEDRRRSGKPYYPDATVYKDALEQEPFDLPIDAQPSTKYALSIEDISTLEDRDHWVARGRLRLIERDTGEIVAEYIGFAANYDPGRQPASPWRWRRYWKGITTELCPNTAEEPEIVRSFLQKILDEIKQP